MINGIKIRIVYHLYCKDLKSVSINNENVYGEINRRCLEHFHDLFDEAIFCVYLDDIEDTILIKSAMDWILSCGFKENLIIKIKKNTAFGGDGVTFKQEVVDKFDDFDGIVFFAHSKGMGGNRIDTLGLRQWIIFSYFACLDNINYYVKNLLDTVGVVSYIPVSTKYVMPYKWVIPGGFLLLNSPKFSLFFHRFNKKFPPMAERSFTEMFIPQIIDIRDTPYEYVTEFENYFCAYLDHTPDYYTIDHTNILRFYLDDDRIEEYCNFFNIICKKLSAPEK